LLGTVTMSYSGANGTWTGQYTAPSLPGTLPAGMLYQVVVTSSDKASPPNTGLGSVSVAPSLGSQPSATTTSTTQAVPSTTTFTTTVSQIVQSIPTAVYAAMVVLLVMGLIIGLVLRMRK